jgi:signal transduction histidine kinase
MDRLVRQGEAVSLEDYWHLLAGAVEALKTLIPPIPAGEGAEGLRLLPQEQKAFLFQAFHEMKNPLHALMGYAGLVLRKSGHLLPEKQKDNLEKVIRSAERLNETINRLAAYCQGEATRSKPL